MRQKYISAFPDDHILQSSSFCRTEIEIVLLWVYRLDIDENCYRLVHVCDCILRRTFWNFFFSARLHFIDNLQPPGSLGMLFLSNACHKSASVIHRQFSCSSSFIRCFSLSCNLISISQHLLNIHRRTSRRQFYYGGLRSSAGMAYIWVCLDIPYPITLQVPLATKVYVANNTAIPFSYCSLPPETHCVHNEGSISGDSLNVYGHLMATRYAAQQASSRQKL